MTPSSEQAIEQLVGDVTRAAGIEVLAGVDRVELQEFARIAESGGEQFLATVYTPDELAHCRGRIEKLATRFAAKEAATKALGTGIRGISLREIEVVTSRTGNPQLRLHDRAQVRGAELGISSLSVSLTHTSVVAEAFVVGITNHTAICPTLPEEKLP
jgi:holo-[acyl-carrier protein] synthase